MSLGTTTGNSDSKARKAFELWMANNASFLGACKITNDALPDHMVNFKSILDFTNSWLVDEYVRLNMETRIGSKVPVRYPSDAYYRNSSMLANLNQNGGLYTYISDMGTIVVEKFVSESQRRVFDTLVTVLDTTYDRAFRETLHLLKESMKVTDDEMTEALIDENGYLVRLITAGLLIRVSVRHIYHPDGLIFVPDDWIEKRDGTHNGIIDEIVHLDDIDFDNYSVKPFFPDLAFFMIDNDDKAISPGVTEVALKKGRLCRTDDAYLEDYILDLPKKIVKTIQL